jgi:Glycosyl hydrolase family 79, N-terminal domain
MERAGWQEQYMDSSGWNLKRISAATILSLAVTGSHAGDISLALETMTRIGTVDERFQSYNIEMVEVTGGPFWTPYTSWTKAGGLVSDRQPKDFSNARLRKLAAALAPIFVRISGTRANTTYFSDTDDAPPAPPAGFAAVLTRRQWQGVLDFSRAVGAPIVTSFAISAGARDAHGVWMSGQARQLFAATRAMGGRIAAAELMNEPNLPAIGGAPNGYDAAAYGRDFAVFRAFMEQEASDVLMLGPGTGSGASGAEMFFVAARAVDAVSYHYYGGVSKRCGGELTEETALSEAWLSRTDQTFALYRALRDRFAPGKPIWLTETADAACGGNPSAATFLDTFRYLDQLARLARAGAQIVMHNTLAASDYGLLDEETFVPRPNYWAALLWRQLMGTVVLDSGVPIQIGLHVYAHCLQHVSSGVALLVINNDRNAARTLVLPKASERYTMDAATLQDATIRLNGATLSLDAAGELPRPSSVTTAAGPIIFAPATITFLAIPDAGNRACQ